MAEFTCFLWMMAPLVGACIAVAAAMRCRGGVKAFFVGFLLTVLVGGLLTFGAGKLHWQFADQSIAFAFFALIGPGLIAIGIPIAALLVGAFSAAIVRERNAMRERSAKTESK